MPAVKGGATETLIQKIIDDNEIYKKLNIDIYCMYDIEAEKEAKKYKFTNFYYIKKELNFSNYIYRCKRKFLNKNTPTNYIKNIAKLINNHNYDFVIIESAYRYIPFLNKKTKNNIYLHLHFDAAKNCDSKLLHSALCDCKGVICVSSFIQKQILNFKNDCKTLVLNNVTDIDLFDSETHINEVEELKSKYNIAENDTLILYSGRLIEVKGVLELVRAFKLALQNNNNLKLLLVGSSEYGETIEDEYLLHLKSELGELLDKSVYLTGYIDYKNMPKFYAAADISILPTFYVEEAAPLSIIEALSSGCCFIGSDSGAIPEIASNSCSIIVERDENFVQNLAKAILKYSSDDVFLKTSSFESREFAVKNYDSKKYYGNFYKILMESNK